MSQGKLTKIIQPDPKVVAAFSARFNESIRQMCRSVWPVPNRVVHQIGDSLDPGYTPGRVISVAQQAGAPLSHLEEPGWQWIAFCRGLFPADRSMSIHAASVAEQEKDGPVDVWQAALREDADEFTLRRGIAVISEQRHALDQLSDILTSRIAERSTLRKSARGQLRRA
jgi:hypothetical protein